MTAWWVDLKMTALLISLHMPDCSVSSMKKKKIIYSVLFLFPKILGSAVHIGEMD